MVLGQLGTHMQKMFGPLPHIIYKNSKCIKDLRVRGKNITFRRKHRSKSSSSSIRQWFLRYDTTRQRKKIDILEIIKIKNLWNVPGGPVDSVLSLLRARVRSLNRELGSQKLHGMAKYKNIKKTRKQKQILCFKDTIKKMKNPTEWKKIFANHI